jgi:hypothetical protein
MRANGNFTQLPVLYRASAQGFLRAKAYWLFSFTDKSQRCAARAPPISTQAVTLCSLFLLNSGGAEGSKNSLPAAEQCGKNENSVP